MLSKSMQVSGSLSLKEATLEDAGIIFHSIDHYREDLRKWLPFVDSLKTVSDEEAFLSAQLSVPYEERNIVYLIRKEGVFCGLIGFVLTDRANRKTEIGYWLLPPFRKQGIVSACVRFLCQWSFKEREMNRVQIRCATGNVESNAVPLRLGFQREGVERDGELLVSGEFTDVHVYSLLKAEYK